MATTLNIGGKKIKVDDSFNDLDAAGQKKVIRRIERDLGVSSSQPAKNEQRGTSLKDVARFGLGQGLALGFGDEIEAGVTSLFGDETYDEAVGRIRSDMDDYRKDNAGKALAMELGGGLLTGGAGLGRAALAAGAKGAIKAGAKSGALTGGLAGAGSGEGIEGRLTGAAIGAGAGGALGGALPAAGNLIGGGVKRVRAATDTLGEEATQKASDLKIIQALEAEGMTPTQAYRRLAQAKRDGVDDTMLVDVMQESGRGLAQGASTVSTKARTIAEDALEARQAKSADVIAEDVSGVIAGGKSAGDALEEISQRQASTSRPAFDAAFRNEGADRFVSGESIADLMEIKAFRDAVRQGLSTGQVARLNGDISDEAIAGLRQLSQAKTADDLAGLNLTAETMHYVKMGFDDVIGMGKTGQNLSSAGRTLQGGLKKAQRQFIDIIDDATDGNYKVALDQFAGNARMTEAVEVGEKIFAANVKPDVIRKQLAEMSQSEKEAFRIGVAQAVVNRGANKRDLANTAADLFDTPKKRELLEMAFPDKATFEAFEKRMKARLNQEITRSRTKPSAGSRTTPMGEDARDITRDAELGMNLLTLNVPAVARDVITRGGGLGKRIGTNVAGDLFDANLASQRQTIQRLNALRAQEAARLAQSGRRASTMGGGVGAMTGLLTD